VLWSSDYHDGRGESIVGRRMSGLWKDWSRTETLNGGVKRNMNLSDEDEEL
jgi:hypothetical protein